MTDSVAVDNLGIPPLAGLCSYADASRPGIGVDRTVVTAEALQRPAARAARDRAARISRARPSGRSSARSGSTCGWTPSIARCCGRASRRCASRRSARRSPTSASRQRSRRCIRAQRHGRAATRASTRRAAGADRRARGAHAALNPLFDQPTHRMLRLIVSEQGEMLAWATRRSRRCAEPRAPCAGAFADARRAYLAAAGGISGEDGARTPRRARAALRRRRYEMDAEPRRDDRFDDDATTHGPDRRQLQGIRATTGRRAHLGAGLQAAARDGRARVDGADPRSDARASRGRTTASWRASCGTRRATR